MAANTKTIPLIRPPMWANLPVAEIVLREPTGGEYVTHGEPRIIVQDGRGGGYWVEQPAVIKAYMEACIQHVGGADLVRLLALPDAMRVKHELFVFFREAEAETMPSASTASSSAPSA